MLRFFLSAGGPVNIRPHKCLPTDPQGEQACARSPDSGTRAGGVPAPPGQMQRKAGPGADAAGPLGVYLAVALECQGLRWASHLHFSHSPLEVW